MKLKRVQTIDDARPTQWMFFCPGCKRAHCVNESWGFSGDEDKPTFTHSVLVQYQGADAGIDDAPPRICHSHVRDGILVFLADCTHALAGQSVEIPEWETRR